VASDFATIDKLQAALTFHRERHAVLAGNVANVDTPGFRPQDLRRTTIDGPLAMTPTGATTPGQIAITKAEDSTETFDAGGSLQGPDGNAVSLERELAKIDANRARYATSAELVSRRLALLRYAAGDGT
jgi:flagellar basal-body rod protein FlgB